MRIGAFDPAREEPLAPGGVIVPDRLCLDVQPGYLRPVERASARPHRDARRQPESIARKIGHPGGAVVDDDSLLAERLQHRKAGVARREYARACPGENSLRCLNAGVCR